MTKILTKQQVKKALGVIGRDTGKLLAEKALVLFDKLTAEEIEAMQGLTQDGKPSQYRLAKLLVISVADQVEWNWSAESFKQDLKRLRRIHKNRT